MGLPSVLGSPTGQGWELVPLLRALAGGGGSTFTDEDSPLPLGREGFASLNPADP